MEYKKLGDIATYINGYAFKPEDREKGFPCARYGEMEQKFKSPKKLKRWLTSS